MKIVTVIGARPQFVKAAVVSAAIARRRKAGWIVTECLVHTGLDGDAEMSSVYMKELGLREPDHHLGVSDCGHAAMTGRMMERVEEVLIDERPGRVVVYGDTNSTLAAALAAAKLGMSVAHVEAGLRSFDRMMPEEINRFVTDHLAELLFAPTGTAMENLRREGVDPKRMSLVGDVMYDAAIMYGSAARSRSTILDTLGLEPRGFVLATVHRAANTDDGYRLRSLFEGLGVIARSMPVIVPLHPRTRAALEREGLLDALAEDVRLIEPVGYLDMQMLEPAAAVIATDSGGVQKEAFFHRVPCLTMRDETEWVELVENGANRLVGVDPERIAAGFEAALGSSVPDADLFGHGDAAELILDRLLAREIPDPTVPAAESAGPV